MNNANWDFETPLIELPDSLTYDACGAHYQD